MRAAQLDNGRAQIPSKGILAAALALAAAGVFAAQSGAYGAATVIGAVVSAFLMAVVLSQPEVGLLIIAATTPVETFGSVDFRVVKGVKFALVAAVAAVLLVRYLRTSSQERSLGSYKWAFAVILFAATTATITAQAPEKSLPGLLQFGLLAALFGCVVLSPLPETLGRGILDLVVTLSILTTFVVVLQSTLGYAGLLGSDELRSAEATGGFATPIPWLQRGSGFFGSCNAAGAFLGLGTLIAVTHATLEMHGRTRYRLAGGLTFLGLVLTFSRGALLGLLAGFAVIGIASGSRNARSRLLAWAALILAAAVYLLPAEGLFGFLRIDDDPRSAGSRLSVWQDAVSVFVDHPITGIGMYSFQDFARQIGGTPEIPQHPHNGLLKAAVDLGVLGGVGYILFLAAFVKTSRQLLAFSKAEIRLKSFAVSVAAMGAALFAQELVDAGLTFGGSSLSMLFIALAGIQRAYTSSPRDVSPEVAHRFAARSGRARSNFRFGGSLT